MARPFVNFLNGFLVVFFAGPIFASHCNVTNGFDDPVEVPKCYSNGDRYCVVVMQNLIEEDNPIKPGCGKCNNAGTVCADEDLRGVFPEDKEIEWIIANILDPGASNIGRVSFTEDEDEVECGRIKKCTGCEPDGVKWKCGTEDRLPWKVKPRRISGDECKYTEA